MCGLGLITDLQRQQDVTTMAIEIAKGVQHRGQLAFGISFVQGQCLLSINGLGLVDEVVPNHRLQELTGHTALIHTRYATSGTQHENLTQPFIHRECKSSNTFALGFNGNIANYDEISHLVTEQGRTLRNDVDTEAILQLIRMYREQTLKSMPEIFLQLEQELDGAFNLGWMNELGEIYMYRGANGNKPMSYAKHGSVVAAASEDSALKTVFASDQIKELPPGALWHVSNKSVQITQLYTQKRIARCFFEWPYFADAASTLHGVHVRDARQQFGAELAQLEFVEPANAVIVPVPNSAIPIAEGYAKYFGTTHTEAITRNFAGRTFIAPAKDRLQAYEEKFSFEPELLDGKDVIIVDDSIVRGGTMQFLIGTIKNLATPTSIHLRLGCPPILAPCFYGIHFPTCAELLARKYHTTALVTDSLPNDVLEAIAKDLQVDSVLFLPLSALQNIVDPEADGLCMACVNGEYPTNKGTQLYQLQR